ncbi:signal transduction histidine kinase [Salsuginibacillus halophilus]|uniref:histidine kinase n=1 Tax=Salsuginibacillus halophilus TaxID=517424 RepID=A0A2P8HEC3_9BACI|nr:HAMP domain-containing sensor histidine kinase [Salsuginibacillus halophilus]PSL44563.1 signal transduction histidine kinase [Salsuginibacillus halophilus]
MNPSLKKRLIAAFLSIIIIPILSAAVTFYIGTQTIAAEDHSGLNQLFTDVETTIQDQESILSQNQLFYQEIEPLLNEYDIDLKVYREEGDLLFTSTDFHSDERAGTAFLGVDQFTLEVATDSGELLEVEIQANSLQTEPFHALQDVLYIALLSAGAGLVTLVVLIVMWTWYISRTVLYPLKHMYHATEEMRGGNLDYPIPYERNDEIGRFVQGFDVMREHLKTSYAKQKQYEDARNVLLASTSHDLRTPLSSIKGYVEGLQDGIAKDEEMRARYLQVIHDKAGHLETLIEDLFEYSKMELEELPVEKVQIGVETYFKEILERVQFEVNREGVAFSFALNTSDRVMLLDPKRIKQVMYNLVDNAVHYGGDHISIQVETIDESLVIRVNDNGPGIAPEDLPHIFQSFYRGEKSRSHQYHAGSGLGLSIVNYIIQSHGGNIDVTSEQDEGATFIITLPVQ